MNLAVDRSYRYAHSMNIKVQKVGGIWHGTIDGHLEIDVRGLTEEIARRRVLEVASQLEASIAAEAPAGEKKS
jgi:hypothetical protein